jgi:hypothetical protein
MRRMRSPCSLVFFILRRRDTGAAHESYDTYIATQ